MRLNLATPRGDAVQVAVITNFGNIARVDLYVNADNISDGTVVVVCGEVG